MKRPRPRPSAASGGSRFSRSTPTDTRTRSPGGGLTACNSTRTKPNPMTGGRLSPSSTRPIPRRSSPSVTAPTNKPACAQGVDDYTGGDTWSKQDLQRLTPQHLPAQGGLLWHGKIYCGNVYHGQGDANQFSDQELIDWINTCNAPGRRLHARLALRSQDRTAQRLWARTVETDRTCCEGGRNAAKQATIPLGTGRATIKRIDALPYVGQLLRP